MNNNSVVVKIDDRMLLQNPKDLGTRVWDDIKGGFLFPVYWFKLAFIRPIQIIYTTLRKIPFGEWILFIYLFISLLYGWFVLKYTWMGVYQVFTKNQFSFIVTYGGIVLGYIVGLIMIGAGFLIDTMSAFTLRYSVGRSALVKVSQKAKAFSANIDKMLKYEKNIKKMSNKEIVSRSVEMAKDTGQQLWTETVNFGATTLNKVKEIGSEVGNTVATKFNDIKQQAETETRLGLPNQMEIDDRAYVDGFINGAKNAWRRAFSSTNPETSNN